MKIPLICSRWDAKLRNEFDINSYEFGFIVVYKLVILGLLSSLLLYCTKTSLPVFSSTRGGRLFRIGTSNTAVIGIIIVTDSIFVVTINR